MAGILVVLVAISAGAFLKGVTGSGLPIVAIPAIASFAGVEEAVVIMAIPGVVANAWLMWHYRQHVGDTRDLPALLGAGIVGVGPGVWLLRQLESDVLSLALAGIIVVYIATYSLKWDFSLTAKVSRYSAPPTGLVAGALQGATGISSPLLVTYLHSYRLDQRAYVFSLATLFQVFALAQVVGLAVLGLYTRRRLGLSVLALLPILVVLPLGARFSGRLSSRSFDLFVLAFLLASAGKLAFDGIAR